MLVMDMFEPNDSLQQAVLLKEGAYTVSGQNNDWYRIETGPGKMRFEMTPLGGVNINMELRDLNGNLLQANLDRNGPLGAETISFTATESTAYTLRVYPAAFPALTKLDYTLKVDLPDNTWSTKLDFGPIRNASVALYDLDNDGRDEIIVGASKVLNAAGDEVRPGGLIVLEDDGKVKWTLTFPAVSFPDPDTGKIYKSTTVSTAPLITDVDSDGRMDIVIGVGGEFWTPGMTGMPGDKGGVYAVSATGQIKWFHANLDTSDINNRPARGPDGTYAAPIAFDIDADGVTEIIYGSWDRHLYVLDGRTGREEKVSNLHDSIGASAVVADLNRDGMFEILQASDISANAGAGITNTGGVLHAVNQIGTQTTPGWNAQIQGTTNIDYRGFFVPQSLWSTPQVGDLTGDGTLEIVHGTGNFFQDSSGSFVTVRGQDGSLIHQLATNGRPSAAPLLADLDGNGTLEIIQTTLSGWVHAWNAQGQKLFDTRLNAYGVPQGTPLALNGKPIAVDLNADGRLEILVGAGPQLAILDASGRQINDTTSPERIYQYYFGSIAARDIDRDGRMDIISGGSTDVNGQGVIYRFENIANVTSASYRDGGYQGHQSLTNIDNFVDRFYQTILQRSADPAGNNMWNDLLSTGVRSGADVARGFIFSPEFQARNLSNTDYVNVLYAAFFGRPADGGGFQNWMDALGRGESRDKVLDGFILSQEFANLSARFGIRATLSAGPEAGPGADLIRGTDSSDILRSGGGDDTIIDQGQDLPTKADTPQIHSQVYRLYGATLGRQPDAAGLVGWVDAINAGSITLIQAAGGFVDSAEFKSTYGALNNGQFIDLLYKNVLGRPADPGGFATWTGELARGATRASVVLGFAESAEYVNKTTPPMVDYMRSAEMRWTDLIEGGTGNDKLAGGRGGDIYVFRAGQGGSDEIYGFEAWDELQLSGFGYVNSGQPMARMSQQGANVVFADQDQTITFRNTTLKAFDTVRWNLS
jgi:hypothetical protein